MEKTRIIRVRIIFPQHAPGLQSISASLPFCHITAYFHTAGAGGQAGRKVAGRRDRDSPALRGFLKRVPIWGLERKRCGGQMRRLSSPLHGRRSRRTWTHLQTSGEDTGIGSWLRIGEAAAPRRWEAQRLVRSLERARRL